MNDYIISDLSVAAPSEALADQPVRDRWLILPYEGPEVSGKMIWCPARNRPPDVSVPLPSLGLCRIHIGLYSSATVPYWFNLLRPPKGSTAASTITCNRLHLRLSNEDWFDFIVPNDFPGEPRFTHICEVLWKTADVSGQSLVLAAPGSKKEVFMELSALVAFVRLVPVEKKEAWPRETKRLIEYFDGVFWGHYVDSRADIKSHIAPLQESDYDTILWCTNREDTCYYPTKVGNRLSDIGARIGVYPYWAGQNMGQMLERGEDPLRIVCDIAHESGLKVFASYRRMTCRMPPFVFPLHPNALMMKRRDLWCADEQGKPVPHLSLAYPEVRQMMIALFVEQAQNYDIEGVHMFFTRGMPFVFFEKPFMDAFQKEYGMDPKSLPLEDARVWKIRSRFFLQFLRDLRAALNEAGKKRGKAVQIAMHVFNNLKICNFYGMDIEAMIRERLVDILLPAHCHFAPRELGEWRCAPEFVAEFVRLAKSTGVRICPECDTQYSENGMSIAELTAAYYKIGVDGLDVPARMDSPKREFSVRRRLGHFDELHRADEWRKGASRLVRVNTVAGLRLDMQCGIPTCG
ncbi:MAG: family 10 glycosylhydrolase [Verrucomicrobia bacterium]|nr:family 10 glycosylhydrolase [Verrucomicrobiota bacterium]